MTVNSISASEAGRQLAAQRTPKQVVCSHCGARYTTIGRKGYCSDRCRFAAFRARRRERHSSNGV